MAIPRFKEDDTYTVGDYLSWPDDERWELIDGTAYAMSPAPSTDHQEITGELYRQIANHLRKDDSPCQPLIAPVDVYLPEENETLEESRTVVQPDVLVVCDPEKVERRGIVGAPDWILEVLSPATSKRDQSDKRALYERHGVGEYWLVHPADRVVHVYRLGDNGGYGQSDVSEAVGKMPVRLLEGLEIDWDEVFRRVRPAS